MKNRSGFLTFISSLIPGVGYMYLGFMKKGLESLVIFFLTQPILDAIGFGGIATLIQVALWFYFFFDTFNLANRMDKGEIILDSDFFFEKYVNNKKYYKGHSENYNEDYTKQNGNEGYNTMDNGGEYSVIKSNKLDDKTWKNIAKIIIVIGVLGIINKAFGDMQIMFEIRKLVGKYFLPVCFIVFGSFLLRNKK